MIKVFLLTALLVGCSNQPDPSKQRRFQEKGVTFEQSEEAKGLLEVLDLGGDFVLAKFADIEFTGNEIYAQSPAIASHRQQIIDMEAALVYKKAKDQGATSIVFHGQVAQESFMRSLMGLGLTPNEEIEVEYKGRDTERQGVGQIDGTWVTEDELRRAHLQLVHLERLIHQEILRLISEAVTRKVIFEDAEAAGLSVDKFIKEKIDSEKVRLDDQAFQLFLQEKGISEADLTKNLEKKLRAIAKDDLRKAQTANYLSGRLKDQPVALFIQDPHVEIDFNREWTVPYVTTGEMPVSYFGNFTCGPCKDSLNQLLQYMDEHPKTLDLGFRFFYVERPVENRMLAEAGMCVQAQDNNKFWKFAQGVMSLEGEIKEQMIHDAVSDSGADMAAFRKCFFAGDYRKIIEYHLSYAKHLGVRSQPTMIFGRQVLVGSLRGNILDDLIDNEYRGRPEPSLWQRLKNWFSRMTS